MTTKEIGDIGEKLAAKFLKKQGYKIKERNIHLSHNEIDIIAEDRDYIVFVEVKTRTSRIDDDFRFGVPSSAVDHKKRAHLLEAARSYLKIAPSQKQPRMDVIEVRLDNSQKLIDINHIRNAYGAK